MSIIDKFLSVLGVVKTNNKYVDDMDYDKLHKNILSAGEIQRRANLIQNTITIWIDNYIKNNNFLENADLLEIRSQNISFSLLFDTGLKLNNIDPTLSLEQFKSLENRFSKNKLFDPIINYILKKYDLKPSVYSCILDIDSPEDTLDIKLNLIINTDHYINDSTIFAKKIKKFIKDSNIKIKDGDFDGLIAEQKSNIKDLNELNAKKHRIDSMIDEFNLEFM